MDVDGVPLNQAFMPLPYRDVTQGLINIIQNVEQAAKSVGGTAETSVGEGRNDAPVGTTIALIEQAQKVINAVHKRMHSAQQKEFMLLKELFQRDPEAMWRNNKNPNFMKDRAKLLEALDNNDIVPKADPNTASQTLRIQKAIAIYTLASQNPSAFDQKSVYLRLFDMLGVEDAQELMSKQPPGPPPVDETKKMAAQAALIGAQAKVLDASVKAQQAQGEQGVKMADIQTKNMQNQTKHAAAKAKAFVDAADIASKAELEQMRLKQSEIVHKDKIGQTNAHKKADLTSNLVQKGLDLEHAAKLKDQDILHQRQQSELLAAQEQNQAASQRLHDLALANQQADLAERAQFMKPEGE
jgi:hypothetical protein